MSEEIFEFFLRLTLHGDTTSLAFQFPDKITDKTVIQSVPKFCFPEGADVEKDVEIEKTESFSFVSTLSDGSKRFGYCRRFFKPSKPPECYCLISYSASFSLFSQVLDIVELKFMEGDKSVYQFLHSILAQPFPDPGQTIQAQTFQTVISNNGQIDYRPETFRLTRSSDDYEYLEYVTFENLFRSLDVDKILLIFECLLNERRMLIVAKTLSTLTSCMDAISNMAYPFSWQYVFIPILPKTMLSFLGAPMPFLIGILSTCLEDAMKEPMEEGVLIVDVDNNDIIQAPDDLPPTMPSAATEKLRKTLKNAVAGPKRNMEFSIDVAHAFLKFWASIFGNYGKYFEPNPPDGTKTPAAATSSMEVATVPKRDTTSTPPTPAVVTPNPTGYTFNFDRFVKSKANEVKKFLIGFKEYQVFQYFMQEREEWLTKGLLNYCIIIRAQNAKKKDSIAAVKAKFKSQVGRVIAAWNDSQGPQPKKEKKHLRPVTSVGSSSQDVSGSPQGSDSVLQRKSKDSFAATSDDSSADFKTVSSTSPLQSEETESEDRFPELSSSAQGSTTTSSKANSDKERPRAATAAPTIPPKPKATNIKKPTTVSSAMTSKSSEDIPKVDSESNHKDASTSSTSGKGKTNTAAAPSKSSSSKASSKDSSTAPKAGTSAATDATPAQKVIPFGSRFTFKPTPLADGNFEKQIWKLCNVESLADTQIMSSEKHKYWVYSPVLFQRLPELSKLSKSEGCIPIALGDDSIESLLQWVFSDEIFLESAESALELLSYFSASESRGGSASTLRQAILLSVLKRLSHDNVLHHLKVFSKANSEDLAMASILGASQLMISKFTPDEMSAIFRRQLSSVSYASLASVLHMKMSASARLDAEAALERTLNKPLSTSISTPRTGIPSERKFLVQDLSKLLETRQNTDITLVFPSKSSKNGSNDGEETVAVHSKILAARSPHLNKILGLNVSDKVSILNVSAAHFKILLPFIYTSQLPQISDDRNDVFELVQAAHVLDLDTLAFREALYASLSNRFTTSSVFEFLNAPSATDGSLQHPSERAVLVGATAYFLAQHQTIFYRPEKLKTLEPDVWECIFKFSYASAGPPTTPTSNGDRPIQVEPEEKPSKASVSPQPVSKKKK